MTHNIDSFLLENKSFFQFVFDMLNRLESETFEDLFLRAKGKEKTALISVDMIEGFCRRGPLASDRVNNIIEPVTSLISRAYEKGVSSIALVQDAHSKEDEEFGSFPPHCIKGTPEADTIKEIRELPFFDELRIFPKSTISGGIETDLSAWLKEKDPRTIIVTGDCTDLCVYQLALYLKLTSNAKNLKREILLPVNAVETYHLPVETALEIGAMPHPGDLMHILFLYHMKLNGIKLVKEIV